MEKEKEKKIAFKPMTDGLGFHPFSEGLPYSPNSNQKEKISQSGSGAVSGNKQGHYRFTNTVPATKVLPKSEVSRPSHIHLGPIPPRPTYTPAPQIQPSFKPTAQTQKMQTQEKPVLLGVSQYSFFYSTKRVLAFLLDSMVNLTICSIALAFVLNRLEISMSQFKQTEAMLILGAFLWVFNWALITAQDVAFGTSVGKRSFSLALEGKPFVLLLRSFLFLISFGFALLGILWAVIDPKRRCWHDILSHTQPIELARL